MTLQEFLVYLVGGGAIVVVSWGAEKLAWFQALSSSAKQWVIYGSSAALAIGAWAVNTYVAPISLEQLAPIFAILATLFASVFVGQAFHFYEKG